MTGPWWDRAACKGAPEAAVAGFRQGRNAAARAEEVRAICSPCLVQGACLDDAMRHEDGPAAIRWGIRGGLTPHERAELARRAAQPKAQPRHGTRSMYNNWACRCDPCTLANAAYQRERTRSTS